MHADNIMYSSTNDQGISADYQEISTPVPLSPDHYEMEHTYESSDALDFPYYAEVGPLLDTVGDSCDWCSELDIVALKILNGARRGCHT